MSADDFLTSALGDLLIGRTADASFTVSDFTSLNTDSRSIQKGQWFLPIVGENHDGHHYIAAAFKAGAKGCFAHSEYTHLDPSWPIIKVSDTLTAFQKLAHHYLSLLPAKRLAITGSAGKTTMKNLMHQICQSFGSTVATERSFNNEIGVPKTIQRLQQDTQYGVFEIAARHVGDIEILTRIVHPDFALCLNVGSAHLGEFGSEERLFQTKMEIYKNASQNCTFLVNADDSRITRYVEPFSQRKIYFGHSEPADVRILSYTPAQALVTLAIQGQTYQVQYSFHHEAHPINTAAALSCALSMGFDLKQSCQVLSQFQGESGRFHVRKTAAGRLFIDDSYNANPASMALGLKSVEAGFSDTKKILILGDMLELGPDSERLHRSISETVRHLSHVKYLFTVGSLAHHFTAGRSEHIHFENVGLLKDYLAAHAHIFQNIDLVYLKSSLGVGLHGYARDLYESGLV